VTFPLTKEGDNTLSILVDELPIGNAMRHINVLPAAASPSHCTASGDYAEAKASQWLTLTVQLLDEFDNPLHSSNHTVTAQMHHTTQADTGEVTIDNNHDGTYTVRVLPISSGQWRIDIQVDGTAIAGSPFR
jgi:hypothetical protein